MKLTKYRHACLFIENEAGKLVIDPGSFTVLPDDLTGVRLVVVSEEHYDHFNLENVQAIVVQSPDVQIYTTKTVGEQLAAKGLAHTVVEGQATVDPKGFNITLQEANHAVVYGRSPGRVLTVSVDDFLYYPSDSFVVSSGTFKVLALPTSGPWHKISESVDFANSMDTEYIVPTHNALLSKIGSEVTNNITRMNIQDSSREWLYLKPGESRVF